MDVGDHGKSHVLPVPACGRPQPPSPSESRTRLVRYLGAAFTATFLAALVLWPRSSGPHCRLPFSHSGGTGLVNDENGFTANVGPYMADEHQYMGFGVHEYDTTQHTDDDNGEPVWCYFNSTHPMPVDSYMQEFQLPLSSPELFIVDKSFRIHGGQAIYDAVDDGAGNVRLRFAFDTDMAGCSVNICLMQKPGGGSGLLLSNYEDRDRASECWRATTVLGAQISFPRPKQDSASTRVSSFRSQLGYVSQEMRGLGEDVFFDDISLESAQRLVIIDSLHAQNLSLRTRTGDIMLQATIYGNAAVESESGSISAGVTLVARSDEDGFRAPVLQVGNFFGTLTTHVALAGDPGPADAIHYTIRAGTVTSPNVLDVSEIPPRANIDLLTQTAFSSTDVTLHPAFEGNITLFSKDGTLPTLAVNPHPEDPERRGRERTVETKVAEDQNGLTIAGRVFWGSQPERPLVGKVLCMSGDEASLRVQI